MDNSLIVQLGINIQKLEDGLNKSNNLVKGFGDKVSEIGKSLVAAFAVERVAEFGVEVAKLSGQFEGVKRVFDQLPNSVKALDEMKAATQGTVSELDLMKYAVQADNFNIPLSQMGSLFEFAHQRAIATGQSVDYLVQSIVTGIGRKSPLILDNLGISAVTLREKLKGVGTESASVADVARVVGEIAHESISKFGLAAETTASKMEALGASWENVKVKIGDAINRTGIFQKAIEALGLLMDHVTADDKKPFTKLQEASIALRGALIVYNADQKKGIDLLFEATQQAEKYGFTVKEIKDQNGKLVDVYAVANEKIDDASKKTEAIKEIIKNEAYYEGLIKDLKDQEKELLGADLSANQQKQEIYQKQLETLQNQFAIQRDIAQSAQLGKMGNYDASVKGLGTAGVPTAPSEQFDKVAASVKQAKAALDAMAHSAPTYTNAYHAIFNSDQIEQFTNTVKQGMASMISALAEGIGEMAVGAQSADQVFGVLLEAAAGMLQQLGQLAISAGLTAIALETLLENPYTAIAAGVALVALAGAVRGAAKNIMGSHGSGGGGRSVASPSGIGSSLSRNSSSSQPMVYGAVQLKGQDLWVVLSNYQTNNKFTKLG